MTRSLANAHSKADCWNPHYHEDGYNWTSHEIFRSWYVAQYHGSVFQDLDRLDVAPLCTFGGGTTSEYTLLETAKLTYAVCRTCRAVTMCGYHDDAGLNPRACGCGAKLGFADYFQPVMRSAAPRSGTAVDPKRDPAVTIAEICAYQEDGMPAFAVAPWILILHASGALATGAHLDYGSFELRSSGFESRELREAFQRERWAWLDPRPRHPAFRLSDNGRIMLAARGITPVAAARREIRRLRGLLGDDDRDRLKVEAVAAFAALLNR